jgi:HJR/Mrr/RecB family endonuclease
LKNNEIKLVPVAGLEPYRPAPEPSLSEKLRKIDWFQFEKLMELIYRHRGYSVTRLGGANPDGGVDLIISHDNEKSLVQ